MSIWTLEGQSMLINMFIPYKTPPYFFNLIPTGVIDVRGKKKKKKKEKKKGMKFNAR